MSLRIIALIALLLRWTSGYDALPEQNLLFPNIGRPNTADLYKERRQERIAIIGAGIGGASAAFEIYQHNRNSLPQKVTIFESESYVGGRIRSTYLEPLSGGLKIIEDGAMHFSTEDWCITSAMEEVCLKRKEIPTRSNVRDGFRWPDEAGKSYIKCNAGSTASQDLLYGTWKYGSLWRILHAAVQSTLDKWYLFGLPHSPPFNSVLKELHHLGLGDAVLGSAETYLQNLTVSPALQQQLVQPCTRGRFFQDLSGVSGLSALMAAGTSTTTTINRGNSRLVERLDEFDIVILAAPLMSRTIDMSNIKLRQSIPPASCIETHVTHFTSSSYVSSNLSILPLDTNIFSETREKLGVISLTTSIPGDKPNILRLQRSRACFRRYCTTGPDWDECDQCDDDDKLYRVHSRLYLEDDDIVRMLGHEPEKGTKVEDYGIGYLRRRAWPHACSHMSESGLNVVDKIEIARDLFYLNGAESIMSSMKMSCRMAKNVAYRVK